MSHPPRHLPPRPPRRRSFLDSPVLAVGIVGIAAVFAVILFLPGILGSVAAGPSATPGATSTPAPTPTPTAALPSFVRPTPSPNPTFMTYVVRTGDTLNSIVRQFGTTARSIAWWNRGTYPSLDPESDKYDPNRLEVGWRLVLIPNTVVDDNNPPTPSPGPSASPAPGGSPSATSGATAAPAAAAVVISHGKRTVNNIALTFDMGGRLDPAVDIVQWLIDHDVHATLFPTGKSGTATAVGLAAMQLAATRPDLFDFGNHSWDHPDFTTLSAAQMATQLQRTEDALKPIVGTTKPWFRPPFGASNAAVRAGVGAAGWKYSVTWDVDTIDWRPVADGGPTAAQIEAKIRNNAQGGTIVLMHLGGWNTLDALPGILDACHDLGLTPVTLTEMLG